MVLRALSARSTRTQVLRLASERLHHLGGIELMSKFQDAMRRIITGDDVQGQSVIIIDGGPSSEIGNPNLGGLFEIWEDSAFGPLTPSTHEDLGTTRPVLGPRKGNFQVRWFAISPLSEGVPKPVLDASMRERFAEFDGASHIIDQTRHPGMHEDAFNRHHLSPAGRSISDSRKRRTSIAARQSSHPARDQPRLERTWWPRPISCRFDRSGPKASIRSETPKKRRGVAASLSRRVGSVRPGGTSGGNSLFEQWRPPMLGGALALFVYCYGWSRCRLRGHFESWRSFRQRRLLDGSSLRPVRRVRRFSRASGIVNLGDGLGAHGWSRCRLRGHVESWRSFRQRRLLDGSSLRPLRRVRRFSRASGIVNLGDGLGAHGRSRCRLREHFESWRSFRQR